MATLKEIKDRRDSIKSINKITSALKLTSTSKAQRELKKLRTYEPFYYKILSIIQALVDEAPYNFKNTEYDKTLWILYSSDLGLAGGFNSLLIKEFIKHFDSAKDQAIIIGIKGKQLLNSKIKTDDFEFIKQSEAHEIMNEEFSKKIIEKYTNENFNIKVIKNHYVNQITTEIKIDNILPVVDIIDDENKVQLSSQIIFEPSTHGIVPDLLTYYVQSQIEYALRDSFASEQSSRRNAMDNATSNSEDMIKNLSRQYNRIRQSKITQEISELVSANN